MANFHQAVLILFVAVSSIQCGIYLVHKSPKTGTCGYTGYVPGGQGPSIKRVTSRTAELQKQQLSLFAFKDAKSEALKEKSKKYYGQLTEVFGDVCPPVGIGLGILGMGIMIEEDVTKSAPPTVTDVIKSVNEAFDEFTKDINERFDRMEHYVNHQIMKSERDLVNIKLRSIFKSWEDCIDEKTRDGAITCQTNAVRKMRGKIPIFSLPY